MLVALAEAFGSDRLAAVCRELTKTHEEVVRAPLGELVTWAGEGVRGEVTLVVAGAPEVAGTWSADEAAARVEAMAAAGIDRKSAIAEVARELGVPKREIFDAVVAAKQAR